MVHRVCLAACGGVTRRRAATARSCRYRNAKRSWLRYNDPRRFGSFHFADNPTETHWLLNKLGVEPLGNEFSGDYLFETSRNRRVPSKTSSWTARSLWASATSTPQSLCSELVYGRGGSASCQPLGVSVFGGGHSSNSRQCDKCRGTTLRDFVGSDGQPGYFKQSLNVYGRQDQACRVCNPRLSSRPWTAQYRLLSPCQTFSGWKGPFAEAGRLALTQRGNYAGARIGRCPHPREISLTKVEEIKEQSLEVQEDILQLRVQRSIHFGHLELVVEICHGA